jgi:hypothetical protein
MNDNGTPELKIEATHDLKGTFEHLLCHNGVVLAVNPSADGVALPPHLYSKPHVVITYELEPVVPIHDLKVDDDGIHATLSFDRTPFATFIPWGAVLAMGPMHAERIESPPPSRPKLKAV